MRYFIKAALIKFFGIFEKIYSAEFIYGRLFRVFALRQRGVICISTIAFKHRTSNLYKFGAKKQVGERKINLKGKKCDLQID